MHIVVCAVVKPRYAHAQRELTVVGLCVCVCVCYNASCSASGFQVPANAYMGVKSCFLGL